MASRYHEVYDSWKRDPQAFWAAAAEEIDWFKRWDKVFDPDAGVYGRWFTGAECNTAYNCLDRHIERGRADQVALIHDSAILGKIRRFTYRELRDEVVALAAVLRDNGIGKGDRVIIYMPMVAEAAIAMLACARIGAVHSVVFGGFASKELATRIDDARPKMVISASCGLEPGRVVAYKPLLDQAIALAENPPEKCLILQREQLVCDLVPGRDLDYAEHVGKARANARRDIECVPVAATDPLYIIYTSGTTGQPKGIVRDNGGHMVALKWTMWNEFGVKPGRDVLGGFRRRLGGRPFLHRLRPAAAWRDLDPVRGQAGRHAGRRHLLARHRRARRGGAVHRADRVSRHQEGRPARRACRPLRHLALPHAVPGRRARRPRHRQMGRAEGRRCR